MNLLKSTGTFGFYTIISRLLGYLRDILIAIFLGTGLLADAFFVAFRIPNTFRRLFSEGTFNAAFVPSYASEMVKGKKQSNKFANNIFNLLFLSLLIITLVVQLLMPVFVSLIAPGFVGDIEKMESLGIYEVVPEDFGLVDFSCTSKIEAQEIVKSGIQIMLKEVG